MWIYPHVCNNFCFHVAAKSKSDVNSLVVFCQWYFLLNSLNISFATVKGMRCNQIILQSVLKRVKTLCDE